MSKLKKIIPLLLIFILVLSGCGTSAKDVKTTSVSTETYEENKEKTLEKTEETKSNTQAETIKESVAEPIIDETVNLMAVGDDLIHSTVINAGKQSDGSYNYDMMFENIKDELASSDLKIINQETVLVNDPNSYSGYPTFGSPTAVGDAIRAAGFNVVTQATNHAYDKRETGINDSINYWGQFNDITLLGIHNSQEDYDTIKTITINDITFALLNYTYGLNGFILPEDKQYLVDTLYDENKVKTDIEKAKTMADFVIVMPHWGTEYVYSPTEAQTSMAQLMADAGADLIIGTHPHVVEPLKVLTSSDGRSVPCYYSLGNFVSAQDEVPRMLGGMAKVTFKKTNDGTYIESYTLDGIVTHISQDRRTFTTYMLKEYTEDLASSHLMRNKKGNAFSLDELNNLFTDITTNY